MYLVYDDFGNVSKHDVKGLKELLIDEIIEDTKQNLDREDIILANISLLSKLALKPDDVNIINELKNYGLYTSDLFQIHRDIVNFIEYYRVNGLESDALETTLNLIGKEL